MPSRRSIPRLNLEEATVYENDEDLLLSSDDEVDEATRAAKKRRIESLGESYLLGRPLFIASASLKGPFDNGWVNPWRKHRKIKHPVEPMNDGREDTSANFNNHERNHKRDFSHQPHGAGSASPLRLSSPRVVPSGNTAQSELSSDLRQSPSRSSLYIQSKASHDHTAQGWLKRHNSGSDIGTYDPPKSPSSRLARLADKRYKRIQNTQDDVRLRSNRLAKSNQTDLRNVRRNKPFSRNTDKKSATTELSGNTAALIVKGKSAAIENPDQQHDRALITEQANTTVSDSACQAVDSPASASSLHIVPPSSQLPEFKYRLAKTSSRDGYQHEVSSDTREVEGCLSPKGPSRSREFLSTEPALSIALKDDASVQKQSSLSFKLPDKYHDSLTESRRLPSAQVVSKPPVSASYFISLHTADSHGQSALEKGTASIEGDLSTQTAFELAQKSFQDDLATPNTTGHSARKSKSSNVSATKRITPFAIVNREQVNFSNDSSTKNTPKIYQNMNTQAMIDALSPFEHTTIDAGEQSDEEQLRVEFGTSNAGEASDAIDLASSSPPRRPSSPRDPPIHQATASEQGSFSQLPLTLSGTTPATDQQDGQGYFFNMDAIDVSQVIKDAGSWLRQSFNIKEELR